MSSISTNQIFQSTLHPDTADFSQLFSSIAVIGFIHSLEISLEEGVIAAFLPLVVAPKRGTRGLCGSGYYKVAWCLSIAINLFWVLPYKGF